MPPDFEKNVQAACLRIRKNVQASGTRKCGAAYEWMCVSPHEFQLAAELTWNGEPKLNYWRAHDGEKLIEVSEQ
jgi:hypothetical protein